MAVTIPLVGTTLVFKRLSLTGDALAHSSLAGVAIGLVFGANPLIFALLASVVAALIIEFIRKKFKKYSEISLAIILSSGIGLAAVLSSFASSVNFNTYLFGSIVAITKTELYLAVGLFVIVVLYSTLFYKEIMYVSYNEKSAKLSGVPVEFINISSTVLSALTIAISSKAIGALIVSSLIVVPVASALQVAKSYKSTIWCSILFSVISVVFGLYLSYKIGLKPGGTIVLLNIVIFIIVLWINFIEKIYSKKQHKKDIKWVLSNFFISFF